MLQRVNADAARPSWSWLPRARTPAEMANDRPVVWVEDVVHDVSHFRTEDSLRLLRLVAALTHMLRHDLRCTVHHMYMYP